VSSLLCIHPQTLYTWKKSGRIPHVILNGRVRFEQNAIDEFLEKRRSGALDIEAILPKFDPSLDAYDKLHLKRQSKGGKSAVGKDPRRRCHCGFGIIYLRKTKKGKDRWYLDYWHQGKRVRKVVKFAQTEQEAMIALQEEIRKTFNKEYSIKRERERILFRDFADVYMTNYAKVKKRSWQSDQKYINAQLIPFFDNLEISEITPFYIQKFMVKRQKDGVRNSTINRELTVLKKMLGLAKEWDYNIAANPVKKGNFFSEEEYKRTRVLGSEEEARLFRTAAPHLKDILTCALSTGLRYSEILGLKWRDCSLPDRQITIRAESSKSGKSRVVPINDELYAVLSRLKKQWGSKTGCVFNYNDPRNGQVHPLKTVRRAFIMACKRAGIEDLTFHDLRHTVAMVWPILNQTASVKLGWFGDAYFLTSFGF